MKLLFLVEKPYHKELFEKAFEKYKNDISYDVDVAVVTNFIQTKEDIKTLAFDKTQFEDLIMSSREVPDGAKICLEAYPLSTETIEGLIKKNTYAFLVNACDQDESGELMFDYTRETCGLLKYKTLKPDFMTFFETDLTIMFKQVEKQIKDISFSRDEMIEFIKNNPNVKISHETWYEEEFVYSKYDGSVYDESGYLFEDWISERHDGLRSRNGKEYANGWKIVG